MIRLYRALLRLYPAGFRRTHADDMVIACALDLEDARLRGAIGVVAFWVFILRDLLASAGRLRLRQLSTANHRLTGYGTPALLDRGKRSAMDTLLQDLRFALRQFARRPGFTGVAVLSLSLAIGGNSLIYGILDGFVLRPFDYPDPDRLVSVGVTFPKLSGDTTYVETLSPAEYGDIRASRSFMHTVAFDLGNRNLSGGDVPERVFTALLLDDPFPVLGRPAFLGRGFTREELGPGGAPVAVISYRLWQTRFGADPDILDRAVRIGGEARSVVGVMPPGVLLIGTDLWIPWGSDVSSVPRNVRQFTILARLAPDATLEQANAELATIAKSTESAHAPTFKEYESWRLTATPWAAALMQEVRPAAFLLLGAVGFVLLIACVNVANLLLARSTMRQRELAVRLALGAARSRLAGQLLTESLVLAVAGAVTGLAIAYVGLEFAGSLIPAQFQSLGLRAEINIRVLIWCLALAAASGVLVGTLPALQATRTDPHDSLKADNRTGGNRAGGRVRQGLVVAEIALSVALLLGAGLLIRSVANLQRVPLGYDPSGVLTMRLTLPRDGYETNEAITAFFEQLVSRTERAPGVTAAAVASQFPPMAPFNAQVEVEGTLETGTTLPTANTTIISRRYFDALKVPLLAGRTFDERDRASAPRVVVVNKSFVERYLTGREPIGARVRVAARDRSAPWFEIVGVVGDARNQGLTAAVRPEIFMSMEAGRDSWNQLFLLVRSDRPASALLGDIRRVVSSIDPQQPVYAIQTLDQTLSASAFQQRVSAALLVCFAAVALILAAIGIFGVMSYSVSARTQEIGVRLAVGATRTDVVWLVVRQVLTLALGGLTIGVGLLLFAGRGLERLLFGVQPADPGTIGVVAALLALVALFAAWVPASRASRVDPIQALRYE